MHARGQRLWAESSIDSCKKASDVLGRSMRRVSAMSRCTLHVATHNLMDARYLPRLLRAHRALHRAERIDALCLQEVVPGAADRVASVLGEGFAVAAHETAPRLALVYDRARLDLLRLSVLELPRLQAVPLWQRLYASGTPERKQALVGRFVLREDDAAAAADAAEARPSSSRRSDPLRRSRRRFRRRRRLLTLVNLHLDHAGDLEHRTSQVRAIASALAPRWRHRRLVACGDTNAFTWDRAAAEPALRSVLLPLLRRHAATDLHASAPLDTHFFARAREPKLGHQLAVAFGRLGVDFPRRYDVCVASAALTPLRAGHVETPDSDHDLVWAALGV